MKEFIIVDDKAESRQERDSIALKDRDILNHHFKMQLMPYAAIVINGEVVIRPAVRNATISGELHRY